MNTRQDILTAREIELFQAMPGNSALLLPDAPTFTIVATTEGYLEISGRHRNDLIGKGLFAAFPNTPDDPEETSERRLRASLEQAISKKEPHRLPLHRYDITMADGSFDERWWSAVNRPVLDESGEVLYIIHAAEDVTLKVKAEQRENRISDLEETHNFFMQAPVAIGIVKGSEYMIELANDSLLEVWGRSADVIGKPVFDAIPELNGQGYRELLDRVCQTGEPFYGYEYPIRLNRQGKEEVFYFDFVYKPYYEGGRSEPVGVFTVGHDVTEQVKARLKVQESEKQFSTLANSISQLAWIADADGWIYWYNNRWYEYTGTTLQEMQGWGWEKVHHPDHIERVVSFVKAAWKNAEPWELTFPLRGADGIYRWFLTRAVPVLNEDGSIVRWIGTNTNVDEQVRAREALKQKQEELQQLFFQAPVSITVLRTPNFIVEVANQMALQMWGKDEEQVLGKSVFEIEPGIREQQEPWLQSIVASRQPFEGKEVPVQFLKNGQPYAGYFDFIHQPLIDEENNITGIVAIGTEVTHTVEARKKIEESEIRFRTLAETLPQMIWMRNMDGRIEFGSRNWEQYSGIKDVSEAWQAMAHPEDWKAIMDAWEQAVVSSTPFRYEVRLKNKDGEYRWHNASGEPVRDEKGEVIKWIGALTDVHEQKTFTERLEALVDERTEALQRSNEDLQQFAHVASHDLKEPVRKVKTFISRLEQHLEGRLDETGTKFIEKVHSATSRMFTMIDGVLRYSTINAATEASQPVNLVEVIKNIETDLEVIIQNTGTQLQYNQLPTIEGAPVLLYQLFYNLVNNSIKFAKAGIAPTINITSESVIVKGRQFAKLVLSDNGIGFEDGQASAIFDTFTRLHPKDKYEGTGLGLALCKKIAERHGGSISANGVLDEGATFTILLPLHQDKRTI